MGAVFAISKVSPGMGAAILWLFNSLVTLYIYIVIAMAIMSWLVAFSVVNPRSPFVQQADRFLDAATRPVLEPIRRIVPTIGGMDLSPIILIFALEFLRRVVNWGIAPLLLPS
jgi:YggT family protein